jgi:hypothetical protein
MSFSAARGMIEPIVSFDLRSHSAKHAAKDKSLTPAFPNVLALIGIVFGEHELSCIAFSLSTGILEKPNTTFILLKMVPVHCSQVWRKQPTYALKTILDANQDAFGKQIQDDNRVQRRIFFGNKSETTEDGQMNQFDISVGFLEPFQEKGDDKSPKQNHWLVRFE